MAHRKRVCIVGTAPSWKQTPWNDPSIEVWSLNDAYALGFPRADRWYELHPLTHLWFRPKTQAAVNASDVPVGHYVRPEGHLEWLRTQAQTIPVFLQAEPPEDWPSNARRFPIEAVEAEFGHSYWASGPSYMLAQAIMEGYTDIWITGIHLATEHEYREQRPQFEMLIGRVLGPKVTETTRDGFRYLAGDRVQIVLPVTSPLCQHGWRYAYDHKPQRPESPYAAELSQARKQLKALRNELIRWPVGQHKDEALDRLDDLEVVELDCMLMLERTHGRGTITAALTGV